MGEEEPPQQPVRNFLYETLTPLGLSDTVATTGTSPQPPPPHTSPSSPDDEEHEPCVVFRNEISLSLERPNSFNSAAPDYFSLDSGNEGADEEAKLPEEGKSRDGSVMANGVLAEDSALEGKWFGGNSRFKSPMLRLHNEILDFCDFLSPTPEEQRSRDAAIEAVSDVIKYIWPTAVVEVFGSFKTGLYLPSSDIDVVILGSNIKTPQIGLHALSRALSQRGIAKKIQVIAKAKVPIIKFVEKRSGVAFDVSFDVDNGPKAAEFIKDAVSKWPPLKPLCLILKVFLQQRELNEVYTGGIGSYALLSMLMALLRTQIDRQASPEHNLGILLVNFFDLYGCKLNTAEVGVSCNGGGIFFPKTIKGFLVDGRPSLIAIEDPQAPENDIGKNSFNYYQARSAFAMAFTTLTNAKVISRLGPNKSILGAIIRPDAVLLERKGGSSEELKNLFSDTGERDLTEHQEIYCNWPMNNEDEETFPRGNGVVSGGNDSKSSSGRKRKSSKEHRSGKKMKDREANGSVTDRYSGKKPSLRRHRDDDSNSSNSRYDRHGSGSSKWSWDN